ncbi:CreA family protein [Magnetofaba australis]|uniref:Putative CreA family protein n=1 Tax=Magnetofaba australis IT-1 TaxID=1434232 RepID=A0A1Y2K3F5_9PROT|nr:CreA family protein [Magnetofaba australis]OSM02561.1 putative CreA family protein [Magnetofaba australis IT-1]
MLPIRKRMIGTLLAIGGGAAAVSSAQAEVIGHVDTVFKMLGPDDKIVIEAFDDPDVNGVACHLSRAVKGGLKGAVGLAEDRSDASIACRQIGPISFEREIEDGDKVFSKRTSALFKSMKVVRFFDRKRNTLIYLVYSEKIIDGSPQNAISTVPIMPWSAK